MCVLLGAGLSGAVLFTPLWPAVRYTLDAQQQEACGFIYCRDGAAKGAWVVMGIVLCLHLLLACGFMLYFFHVPPTSGGAGPTNVTEVVTKVQQQEGGPVQEQEVSKEEEEKPVKESTSEKRSVSQGGGVEQQTSEEGGGVELNEGGKKNEVDGDNKQATESNSGNVDVERSKATDSS